MGRRIGKIIGIIVAVIIMAGVGYVGYVWSKYQEPEIVDAQIQDEEIKGTISREKLTVVWFEEWKRGHQGWKVPFSYRLKDAKIISIEELEMGYVEVHYQARIPGISRKVVDNLELIGTDEKNVYQGQWVLKWKEKTGGWCIAEAISPVQYQIQSPEFAEEMQRPQTAHYAFDTDKTETYYVQDGVLYVTYDGGENFIEVPDGYETVLCTPNGTYDEYLPENSCLVSSSFTAFIAYENGTTKLLYSLDQGQSWSESVIYNGGYRANNFISKTDNYYYVSFALDRTGGSDYYGTFRSADLEGWERAGLPGDFFSNAVCIYWRDDSTGYYAQNSGDGYYMTVDGGSSYELCELPEYEEITLELGYNPYDCPETMYQEDGILYMVIGQGDDGDYAKDGKLLKALFQSEDGVRFTFVKEITDERNSLTI